MTIIICVNGESLDRDKIIDLEMRGTIKGDKKTAHLVAVIEDGQKEIFSTLQDDRPLLLIYLLMIKSKIMTSTKKKSHKHT